MAEKIDRRTFMGLVGGSAAAVASARVLSRDGRDGLLMGDVKRKPFVSFPTDNPNKPLTIAHTQSIPTLDPDQTAATATRSAILEVYDTLVDYNETLRKVVPRLATSWTIVDTTTIDFNLRKGVKFSNGESLNATSVVFTLNRTKNPATKSLQASIFSSVDSVEARGSHVVRWNLTKATPLLLQYLTIYPILPPRYVRSAGSSIGTAPVGSGPYRLTKFRTGVGITLERNPNYWGTPAAFRYAAYRTLPSSEAQLASLLSGEVQIASGLDATQAKQLSGNPKVKVMSKPTLLLALVTLTQSGRTSSSSPTRSKLIRQALNQGVNRDRIVKDILRGHAVPNAAGASPLMYGYTGAIQPWKYDPAEAKKKLEAAGHGGGLSLRMISQTAGLPDQALTAQAVQGDLAKIGVKVSLDTISTPSAVGSLVMSGKAGPMIQFGNSSGGVFDVGAAYSFIFQCKNTFSYFCTPRFQALYNRQASTLDEKVRHPILARLQRLMKTECGALFEWDVDGIWATNSGIAWTPSAGVADNLYTAKPS
ncbi:MAG: ABC transporter substrate-binding protein [Actinomycetota bacterium]|nr:ABC transporter substrate-binding protein [Actinomycetota bacterium]